MPGSSRRIKIAGISLVLTTLALGGAFYYQGRGESPTAEGEVVVVRRGDLRVRIAETGSLEPITVVEIKSEQSGVVRKLFVRPGDPIQAGERLVLIQQESNQARLVAQFRANLEQERLNQEEAERELSRSRELASKGFIAQKEVETAEKTRENAKILYDLAKRQLLLILGGNLALYEKVLHRELTSDQMEEFSLYSPISGTVLEVKVAEGEIVSSGTVTVGGGTTLMRLADLSKMLVKTKINEVNIRQVKPGQPVELHLDALPGSAYRGTVSRISPNGEKINNVVSYEVTIELENIDRRLMPLMTANVDIIAAEAKNALILPLSALVGGPEETSVQVLEKGGRVSRPVRLGITNEGEAEVVEGLREGDRVLLPKKKGA